MSLPDYSKSGEELVRIVKELLEKFSGRRLELLLHDLKAVYINEVFYYSLYPNTGFAAIHVKSGKVYHVSKAGEATSENHHLPGSECQDVIEAIINNMEDIALERALLAFLLR